MCAFNPYRARVLPPPTDTHDHHANTHNASSSRQLRRQAALFDRYRQLTGAAQQDGDADAHAGNVDDAPHADDGGSADAAAHEHSPALAMHDGANGYLSVDGFVPYLALPGDTEQGSSRDDQSQQQHEHDDGRHGGQHDNSGQQQPAARPKAAPAANPPTAARDVCAGGVAGSLAAPLYHSDPRLFARASPANAAAAVTPHDAQHAPLVDYLVSTLADFCSNSAVHARGVWQLTIALDPQHLPECQLHLALSHFDLSLRFETASNDARQLISLHAAPLRVSLASLLKQSAPELTRSIEIIIC
jgi:type III secretion control protein HpaP